MKDNIKNQPQPAIWNPDKALEGVFCPTCGCWMDDYYGQPDKCPRCGQVLEGWMDGRIRGRRNEYHRRNKRHGEAHGNGFQRLHERAFAAQRTGVYTEGL